MIRSFCGNFVHILWVRYIETNAAAVAQSVERQSHNLKVVSSILTRGISLFAEITIYCTEN